MVLTGRRFTTQTFLAIALSLGISSAAQAAQDTAPASAVATPDESSKAGPKPKSTVVGQIKFSNQSVDFGEVLRGQKLKQSFTFTNTGKGQLVIQGVHASCGCLATEVSKGKEYGPGQSGAIDVTLDTTNFAGTVVKAVTVITNERQLADRTLTLRALVREEIVVDPPVIDFGEVMSSQGGKQTAIVRAVRGKSVDVNSLKFNESVLKVTSDKTDKEWLLTVELKPDLTPGFLKETVIIKNTSKALPDMPLLIRANVRGNILASPKYLEFGAVPRDAKIRRTINLDGFTSFEITKNSAELTVNGAKVTDPSGLIKVDYPGESTKKKEVVVELTNDGKVFGAAHGRVNLDTSDPKTKTLSIDFYAFFK